MTLTEHDQLKKKDPARYWELYFWLLIPKLKEKEEMDKRKADLEAKRQGYSTQKDVGSIPEGGLNQEFYSQIITKEDIESGKYKLPE